MFIETTSIRNKLRNSIVWAFERAEFLFFFNSSAHICTVEQMNEVDEYFELVFEMKWRDKFFNKICFQTEAALQHENGLDSFQTTLYLSSSSCSLNLPQLSLHPVLLRDFYHIHHEITTQQQLIMNVEREKRMFSVWSPSSSHEMLSPLNTCKYLVL